ncbi:hypothetical protein [Myroides odoratimimus]|nr:hypothetical protein [Myroides odoratimimus]MCO7721945.1 hypothetical protein [Myroides odoratimimus]MDM1464047.1 hypothetical protein [Myroides odoratimimus]MDM1473891.1 hypothetical protein [Myroides odoratimimus]
MNDTIDIAGALNEGMITFIKNNTVFFTIIFIALIVYIAFRVLLNKNSTK